MAESIKTQNKDSNIKDSFHGYKQSSYRTQWELAFKQNQYLEQNNPESWLSESSIKILNTLTK